VAQKTWDDPRVTMIEKLLSTKQLNISSGKKGKIMGKA